MTILNEIMKDSAFLVTNASGRHINLLNDSEMTQISRTVPSPPSSEISDEAMPMNSPRLINQKHFEILQSPQQQSLQQPSPQQPSPQQPHQQPHQQVATKRKYHCIEPGCTKSFTTSGHLARHNRIHTGEKNFPCLFPGCQSRFSRQDNMMQHYRTHMSPKSKRTQKKIMSLDVHPRPRLHAHQRIRSDRYQIERPLTIDQHLNNYHESLISHSIDGSYDKPTLIGRLHDNKRKSIEDTHYTYRSDSHSSSSNSTIPSPSLSLTQDPKETDHIPTFYQHKTLHFSSNQSTNLPSTLLHPICHLADKSPREESNQAQLSESHYYYTPDEDHPSCESNSNELRSTSSRASLLQLADIVSTFG
ncbi:hypothetical protein BDB01DRAFT_790834 [Pilobolus umbonatus]|nr:hypothetical protein BDB01DRAFT_790834 [Pilobolus umbonatus]